jgi:hypothetical protein
MDAAMPPLAGETARFSKAIEAFFQRGVTAGLHLPDRWYGGRPMQNQYELTLAH